MTSPPDDCPALLDTARVEAARRDLGRRLAAARYQAGYTQRAFAPRIGYSRAAVSDAELGRHTPGPAARPLAAVIIWDDGTATTANPGPGI